MNFDDIKIVTERGRSPYPKFTEEIAREEMKKTKLAVAKVYFIDDMAAKWMMSINTDRNRKPHDADFLVRAHLQDEFELTTDSIGITPELEMYNGQNRLRTFLRARRIAAELGHPGVVKGFPCIVMLNAPQIGAQKEGENAPKKAHEIAKFMGIDMSAVEGRVSRRMLSGIDHRNKFSNDEIIKYYLERRAAIRWVCDLLKGRGDTTVYADAITDELRAIMARAYILGNPKEAVKDRLSVFAKILKTGVTDGTQRQQMVANFADRMRKWKLQGGDFRRWAYALTDMTLDVWINGGQVLRYPRKLYRSESILEPTAAVIKFFGGWELAPLEDYVENFPVHKSERALAKE